MDRPAAPAVWQRSIQQRLEAVVTETIAEAHWAPFVVQLGISHEETYFNRSGELLHTLAMALPHLRDPLRQRTVEYLDRQFVNGAPFRTIATGAADPRREHYELSPEVLARSVQRTATPGPEDLYALWAYAHHANRWPEVLACETAIRDFFATRVAVGLEAAHGSAGQADIELAPDALNQRIAGTIAYGRIMRQANDAAQLARAADCLARLVTERVFLEQADRRLQQNREHYARLPRYEALVPETGRLLAASARDCLQQNLADIDAELPVWYQAFGERLVGGENYINSPRVSQSVFLAMAYAQYRPGQHLTRYLDQPWCRADLMYIAKLTALLTITKDPERCP